jgi:hypothetical protein
MSNSHYLQQIVNRDLLQGSGDPDHMYVDINIINNDNGANPPVQLQYRETRDSAIVADPSEYYISIVRFRIDTQSGLPLMIPQIQTGQNDPNLTIYSFTLVYKTYKFQQFVEFIPQDKTAANPKFPIQQQDLTTGYYYLYNYNWWVDLMNIALATCLEGFQNLLNANDEPYPTNKIFFMYDPASSELVLNADKNFFDESLENPCYLFCNTPMKNLLSGFNFEIDSYAGNVSGCNFKFVIENQYDTNTIELNDSYTAIQSYQQYSSTATWSCVQSIVITTASMPVVATIQATPKTFGSITNLVNYSANINVQIISDFEIAMESGKEFLPAVNYSPMGIYRLVPMTGNNPLHEITLEFWWRDIYNNLHPFRVGSNSHCDVKLLFRKKYLGV